MIERKYQQRQLGEGFIRDSIDDCWEPWMKIADEILDDEELIEPVYEALRRRRPKSATRGRKGTPAEVALRMLALKHMRNWSFEILEREVRANLVYRVFTRVGAEKVHDAATQIIRKGKSAKPTEFGRLIKIQEAENQIITDYEVCDQRPADSTLLIKSLEAHQQKLGRVPHTVATDAGFFSGPNETAATKMGVKRVSIPNRSTKSAERRLLQKKRWFRQAQAWRTGCEGRISVLKRRHGLNRCRYRGDDGMKRWVGLAVIADNLINIGRILALQATKA